MDSGSKFCHHIYGHNARTLDYIAEFCSKYGVVCFQRLLLTLELCGSLKIHADKAIFIHEAVDRYFGGRPSGRTAFIPRKVSGLQENES